MEGKSYEPGNRKNRTDKDKRVRTSILIDNELFREARDAKLNISACAEDSLIYALNKKPAKVVVKIIQKDCEVFLLDQERFGKLSEEDMKIVGKQMKRIIDFCKEAK